MQLPQVILRWGADGKVRQLEGRYPQLAMADPHRRTQERTSPDQQRDVAAVVKASQALSSEMLLPRLIERLMASAIENAGADRGLLILPAGDEYLIEAEARATDSQIEVTIRHEPITRVACPESLVRYVIRTQESVILDDASKPKRLHALFSKKDLTIESVDLNEGTREVIALSLNEFQREGVVWRAELADDRIHSGIREGGSDA